MEKPSLLFTGRKKAKDRLEELLDEDYIKKTEIKIERISYENEPNLDVYNNDPLLIRIYPDGLEGIYDITKEYDIIKEKDFKKWNATLIIERGINGKQVVEFNYTIKND